MIKVKFLKPLYPFNKGDIGEVEKVTYEMFKNILELIKEKESFEEEKENKAILTPKKKK